MIRHVLEADLEAVVAIYNAAIPSRLATADTEPVSVDSRRAWFREHSPDRYPLWVDERAGRVAGWVSFSRFHPRPAYAPTTELSVYVDPAMHRRGVAAALLEHALAQAPALGFRSVIALIFGHNEPSLALFRRFGFVDWGHLPRVAVLDDVERDVAILGLRVAAPRVA